MSVRYLLDENIDPLYRRELLRREPAMTVWRVGDVSVPADGMPDPDILRWCESRSFMLVTNNRKSIPPHLTSHLAEGRHIPGIIVLNDRMSVGQTIQDLWLLWAIAKEGEYSDRVT